MKKYYSLLSLILSSLMILSSLTACTVGDNGGQDSSSSTDTGAVESSDVTSKATTDTETVENTTDETASSTTEDTDEETTVESDSPLLEGDHAVIIEGAEALANGVNAYFDSGERKSFITENQSMKLSYSTNMLTERKLTSLTDKNGNTYIENTMDIFVRMQNGSTYYASKTANSAKVSQFAGLNVFRYGYYYYNVRFEDQNFVNDIKIEKELSIDFKNVARKEGVKTKSDSDGLTCQFTGNSVDPQVVFDKVSFNTAEYDYLAITMKSDLPATNEADCQFFIKTSAGGGYKNVSFDTVNDGEYHTYYVYIGGLENYSEDVTELRLDFSMSYSTSGATVSISDLKAIKANINGAPQNLGVARILHTYSDKLHQELQFAASKDTSDIAEVGIITRISADTVDELLIKDKNGAHTSIEDIDSASIEYIGFDIKDVGIFGLILPAGCTDTLTVTLENGVYTVIQSATPEGGTIKKSEKDTNNANDFHMGHRIYTDGNHDFDAFMLEATIERTPLGNKSFKLYTDKSSSAEYLGYDPLRGCYTFSLSGTTFSPSYFEYPNKHFRLCFDVKSDEYDRTVYVMATTRPYGHLEAAVLMSEDDMLLPVPLQVSKNFKGDGEANLYNIDDEAYGETILPLTLRSQQRESLSILNLYQNWGTYPLKQISSVQYFVPYYHLSTGVTETNCLKPWYYTSIARDHWNLPDHRAWSAPFWHTIPGHTGGSQPQHTLGGAHYFLEYVNADGDKIITENTKNTITSSGPTYAEVISDYVSDDGNIKVSYTHTELPQSDENRTYYQIKYDVLGDVKISNFKTDFSFYAVMDQIGKMNYTKIGYLDENNKPQVVDISGVAADKYYTLGNACPYISYFNNPNSDDYVNVSFLIYNSEFTIGGKECNAPFVLVDRGINDMEKIALTLDLGEVTLKAGDSFTINAILMPWGSQLSDYSGDEPDKNVRDVRENSLLDPFRGKAIADCEAVESVFIPKFRTTNGKSAEFSISGGENNVAVRIYGFDMLTAPQIYEKIDGEWVEYVVSSKDTADKNGYSHYYDGYGVHYDGDGTFSYSFVTTITDGAERIFKIEAEEEFKRWPEEGESTEGKINVFKNASNLYDAASIKVFFGATELLENDTYLRLTAKDTDNKNYEAYFTAFSGEGITTGQYLVFKYRLPSTNVLNKDTIEVFASTENASETGGDNFNVVLSADGEWHIAIIDLSKAAITNGFKPNGEGLYSVKYVRLDPFNGKTPSTESFDIAFLALVDGLEKLPLFSSEIEYGTLYEGNKRTPVKMETGELADVNVSYIHPESGYKSSTLAYATHLDMINGKGGASASYTKRGGNSVSGIDIFDYHKTTINGSKLVFSGWTVVEGGIEKYVWSVDGKNWYDTEPCGRELGDASQTHLDLASAWFLGGYKFADAERSFKNAVYQSPTGLGDATKGICADLAEYEGQTVNVTFAAIPASDTTSLCLIAQVKGVTVLPSIKYKVSSVAYASHLDMINGKGGDSASYSMRGGNSQRGVDTFALNGKTINGSKLIFSGWTVADGGIDKYAWSADGGATWHDTELCGISSIGKAQQAHLNVASGSFLNGYAFKDSDSSLSNAVYQSPTGLGNDTRGLSADLSDYVGKTVDVIFAAVPTAESDSYCLIARVTGVEVVEE